VEYKLIPLCTSATNWPLVLAPGVCEYGDVDGMKIGKGNRTTRRKPALPPLCPPQISLYLARAQNRAAVLRIQRLTSWAMAWPTYHKWIGKVVQVHLHVEGRGMIAWFTCWREGNNCMIYMSKGGEWLHDLHVEVRGIIAWFTVEEDQVTSSAQIQWQVPYRAQWTWSLTAVKNMGLYDWSKQAIVVRQSHRCSGNSRIGALQWAFPSLKYNSHINIHSENICDNRDVNRIFAI
jgi:hypothetical protein